MSELCRKDQRRRRNAEARSARPPNRRATSPISSSRRATPPSKPAPKPRASQRKPTRRVPRSGAKIRAQIETALTNARDQTKAALDTELDRIQRKIDADTAAQQAKLDELKDYLNRLDIAHGQFETWFGQLKQLAGSHAADIPPPPAIPTLPADLNLGGIKLEPVADLQDARSRLENALTIPPIDLNLPELPPTPKIPLVNIPEMPVIDPSLAIPGIARITEVDLSGKESRPVRGLQRVRSPGAGFRRDLSVDRHVDGGVAGADRRARLGHARTPALGVGAAVGDAHRQVARALRRRLPPDGGAVRRRIRCCSEFRSGARRPR